MGGLCTRGWINGWTLSYRWCNDRHWCDNMWGCLDWLLVSSWPLGGKELKIYKEDVQVMVTGFEAEIKPVPLEVMMSLLSQ